MEEGAYQKIDYEPSLLDNCLQPLLNQLGWKGDEELLHEYMPHLMSIENIEKFSYIMKNLGFSTKKISIKMAHLSEKTFPCLFIPEDNSEPLIIISNDNDNFSVFNSKTKKTEIISDTERFGLALTFKKHSDDLIGEHKRHWFKEVIYDCKGMIFLLGFVSFLQAVLFIIPPAYIMFLYDKVVNTNSYMVLVTFFIGIVFALIFLVVLMGIRTRLLGYFGSTLQRNIGNLIFLRLLKLQPMYIESAPLSKQMIRINDFNQLREFFGGQLFSAVLDVPFTTVFLFFIWLVAGWMVLVPIVAIVFYFLAAMLISFFSRRHIASNATIRGKYQNYLIETFGGMRSLQYSGLQDVWYKNFKEISALSSHHGRNVLFINNVSESVFDSLTIFTGIMTLVVGTVFIVNNVIQIGALIAVLFVIWRLLAPIKMICVMYPRLVQVKNSAKQINQLMQFPLETPVERKLEGSPSEIKGEIKFDQVSFKYPNADTLALKNINFKIEPGKTLLIIGPTGSGKSTIANLILNIYPIMGGYIFVDGKNIKQYDVNVLRKNISFVPQKAELFYGTIAQNIRLAKPLASDEELVKAAEAANLLNAVNNFPDGFDTRIKFYGDDRFGASFTQKINLARAYLRDAPVYLFDEPTSSLDENNIEIFSNHIKNLHGDKTIILMGHSQKFIDLADHVIVLYDGYLVSSGKPEDVLKNVPKGMI